MEKVAVRRKWEPAMDETVYGTLVVEILYCDEITERMKPIVVRRVRGLSKREAGERWKMFQDKNPGLPAQAYWQSEKEWF